MDLTLIYSRAQLELEGIQDLRDLRERKELAKDFDMTIEMYGPLYAALNQKISKLMREVSAVMSMKFARQNALRETENKTKSAPSKRRTAQAPRE